MAILALTFGVFWNMVDCQSIIVSMTKKGCHMLDLVLCSVWFSRAFFPIVLFDGQALIFLSFGYLICSGLSPLKETEWPLRKLAFPKLTLFLGWVCVSAAIFGLRVGYSHRGLTNIVFLSDFLIAILAACLLLVRRNRAIKKQKLD